MTTISPIKLHINRNEKSLEHNGKEFNWVEFQVIATFADGTTHSWGEPTNQRGAKCILTRHAKRFGLTKAKDGLSAE